MSPRFVSIAALVLCLTVCFQSVGALAQAPNSGAQNQTSQLTGTRKQLATIIFAGLAGAILGLSTLSFYGKPQDKLDNIAVGAAFGIIGGAIYTTYQVATAPYDIYNSGINQTATDQLYAQNLQAPKLRLQWDF